MARDIWGLLLVDKPAGITSHDVVDSVRRKLGTRRVGHGGTLDPLATGLLVILVGKFTKLFPRLSSLDKKYEATLRLGASTTTGDIQGQVLEETDYSKVSSGKIKDAFSNFKGDIMQVPPTVCALRYKGRRLYQLARKGKPVSLPPRKVTIHSLDIRKINLPDVDFYIHCSKGTYVRKLAEDIGSVLRVGAYIIAIRRTQVGPFSLTQAVELNDVDEKLLIRQVPEI